MEAVKDVKEATTTELGALLDDGDGAMVTLVAGDTRLVAHRAVLAARSPVFMAMFGHDTLEASSGQVAIHDMEGPVLRHLLAYLYTLQAPLLSDTAPQLLAAADKYGLLALKAHCEQQMVAQLAVENAAATAVFAVRHSCSSLRQAALAFIKTRTHQVMATQGWADAMLNQPKDLIQVSQLLYDPPPKIGRLSAKKRNWRLIEAAQEGAVGELRALLAVGANVGAAESGWQRTALHFAAEGGHVQAASCLLEAGAQVDARDSHQNTPLHYAAVWAHTAVARLLLSWSADPNARADDGRTPLHGAATNGNVEAAAALLNMGADKGARDKEGKTPLDLARQKNEQRLIQMLS